MNKLKQPPRQQNQASRAGQLLWLLCLSSISCDNPTAGPPSEASLPWGTHLSHATSVSSTQDGEWSPTGAMAAGRLLHSATLLADGRVLAIGGYNRSTELYAPGTGTWSPTTDALNTHRAATATRLPNGKVLLASLGGAEWNSGISAELFDPATGTWAATGNLGTPRLYHTATLLPDGRVLVTGGATSEYAGAVLSTAEVYDSTTGAWTATAPMATSRRNHTATLLSDGRVLVTGGTHSNGTLQNSAEVYDSTTGTWSPVGSLAVPRASHSATLLPDGRVLVSGGGSSDWNASTSAELFNPATGTWTMAASMVTPRRFHSATLLASGLVLVAGGFHEYTGVLTAAEVYDPNLGSWRPAGDLSTGRYLHTATRLADGRVLVAGGFSNGDQASAEVFTPSDFPPESPSEPAGTSLLLQVVDTAGTPIPGAVLTSQDALFSVNSSGHRLFENLQPGRFLARVDALGFTSATAVVELSEGAHVGTRVLLHPLGDPLSFQAEQGGLIQTEQVRVTIPPNAIVDALGQPVTGTVNVTIVPLDPTSQLPSMPGPLEGIAAANGEAVQLESLFMAEMSLWSNGAPAQLAPGASATLEFLIPAALASQFQAGDTVPAWWFDLDVGHWREEGFGTFQPSSSDPARLAWVAQVNHFSWWNSDFVSDKSCVNVFVVDELGAPVAFVPVKADGVSYAGLTYPRYTGVNGQVCIEIKQGHTANISAGLPGLPITGMVTVTGTQALTVCGTGPCQEVTLVLEDIICTPGALGPCSSYSGPPGTEGQGLCRAGCQQCNVHGTQWIPQAPVLPTAESCQLPFDEDCDGAVNENCVCSPQQGSPCYGGLSGTQGVGICQGGTVGCDLFGNVACLGQQLPQAELCWTPEDEDCNGVSEPCQSAPPGWSSTGSMALSRSQHTATRLLDGRVLVAGGGSATAEVYDPASGTWSSAGSMAWPRLRHTATRLLNGKVLVTGGLSPGGPLSGAEVYDPATDTWSSAGSMASPRLDHAAALLSNGKVLISGGVTSQSSSVATAEVYDPASNSWTTVGSLMSPRDNHTATTLPDGRVLVSGGIGLNSAIAQVYDPATSTWSATGSLATMRWWHTATLLPNGKVLVAAGFLMVTTAEIYDPATGTWSATGSLAATRSDHTATLLPNGKVLVAGGDVFLTPLATVEVYDPTLGTWSAGASMATARTGHTATLLANGKVLVAGGGSATAELYTW